MEDKDNMKDKKDVEDDKDDKDVEGCGRQRREDEDLLSPKELPHVRPARRRALLEAWRPETTKMISVMMMILAWNMKT